MKWLAQNEGFNKWQKEHGTQLLHIHGSPRISEFAELVFQDSEIKRDTDGGTVLYFKFDKYDIRRNSVQAMANSFLSQIFRQYRISPEECIGELTEPDFDQCWTEQDAFFYLDKIRRELGNRGRVIWILDGLDQCKGSAEWMLSELTDIAGRSEQYFKILIATFDGMKDCKVVGKLPFINLQQYHEISKSSDNECSADSLHLLCQERPLLQSLEQNVRELLDSCAGDYQLRVLVHGWLQFTRLPNTASDIAKYLKGLYPATPAKIFERILLEIPDERKEWAKRVVMWVLRSLRPLSPEELELALAIQEKHAAFSTSQFTSLDLMDRISECFGPLFCVKHGEIYLSHPGGRPVFFPQDASYISERPWYALDCPDTDNRTIAETCLHYLALDEVQDRMRTASTLSDSTQSFVENQSNFLSYAVQYWPKHCRLSCSGDDKVLKTTRICGLLSNPSLMRSWVRASWHFANPMIRADQSTVSLLATYATVGLEIFVTDMVSLGPISTTDVAEALIEAIRHGHRGISQLLMKIESLQNSAYEEVLKVAARSGNFDIFQDLLDHIKSQHRAFTCLDFVASRAVFFGRNDVLESLFTSFSRIDVSSKPGYLPPLSSAAMRNNSTGVQSLLRHDASQIVHTCDSDYSPPLVLAAKFGHAGIIKTLLTSSAVLDARAKGEHTALWTAAAFGQHKALQALLDRITLLNQTALLDITKSKKIIKDALIEDEASPILVYTASGSCENSVRILLVHDADPDVRSKRDLPLTPLSAAAAAGNAAICSLLLDNNADYEGMEGDRPIVYAIASQAIDVVRLLLKKGANASSALKVDDTLTTPLMIAANLGREALVELLLEYGADVNAVSLSGKTALHSAADSGSAGVMKLLLDAGADFTKATYKDRWTPLHASFESPACIRLLLDGKPDRKANINTECAMGTTLCLAALDNQVDSVKLLISRNADMELKSETRDLVNFGLTPLHEAAARGWTRVLRILLEAGADKEARNSFGSTPLISAVSNTHEECVRILLEFNPKADATSGNGDTCLHRIGRDTPLSLVKLLVNYGVPFRSQGEFGFTVLDQAILEENIPAVHYLLGKTENVNEPGSILGGPLHVAAFVGNIDLVRMLIDKGAMVNLAINSINNGTPLMAAFYSKKHPEARDELIRYLIDEASAEVNASGGYFGTALNVAILRGSLKQFKFFSEKKPDIQFPDALERLPIHYASFRTLEHVQLLLKGGADLRSKNKMGQTPLHIAVLTGRVDLVEFILSKVKDCINDQDSDGWTPLLWACRVCGEWGTPSTIQPQIIQLLISNGADLWTRGLGWDQEWSPIKLAMYHGASDEVIQLLTPKSLVRKQPGQRREKWDHEFHKSRKAQRQDAYCDVCLCVSSPVDGHLIMECSAGTNYLSGYFWHILRMQRML
jgi:ankyrin repeat protein